MQEGGYGDDEEKEEEEEEAWPPLGSSNAGSERMDE